MMKHLSLSFIPQPWRRTLVAAVAVALAAAVEAANAGLQAHAFNWDAVAGAAGAALVVYAHQFVDSLAPAPAEPPAAPVEAPPAPPASA